MQVNSSYVNIYSYYSNFGYLDKSNLTNVENFGEKMYKICCFLYFAKFYRGWCDCPERSKHNFLITKSIY